MDFVPTWSRFTLPRRGKICELDVDIAEALTDEYRIASRARNLAAIALWETDSNSDGGEVSAEDDDDDGSSHSSSLCSTSWPPSDSDTETDLEDSEYIPAAPDSPIALDSDDIDLAPGSEPFLRPRPAPAPSPDLEMTPVPDTFTRSHLRALDFDFVSWHGQPGLLVDLRDRIGAMYIGGPVEALAWERSVIEAGQEMLNAHQYLRVYDLCSHSNTIAAGLQCSGPAGKRPQNMWDNRAISGEHIALAALRYSPHIQAITSFQNAMLRKVAPHAWSTANGIIDTLLAHDSRLHLPFHLAHTDELPQPTAFSRVEYQFSTEGSIRREDSAYILSLSALTSLGNYDQTEGELILWTEKKVINFPVGATFLMPRWLPYSFTSVESPGFQMILTQTCDNALCEYVTNGFSSDFEINQQERSAARGSRKQEAATGANLYGTLAEFDARYEDKLDEDET